MLKLIVNGDDFGLTEATNEGIIKCYKDGILRSASIMANGNAFEHAVKIIGENPGLDVGIHLTLIEEKPILNGYEIPSLINSDGRFYKNANDFMLRYIIGKISIPEIEKEFKVQIEKAIDFGIKLNHINSHQHIHMLPQILNIVVNLSKKYNIPFVRYPKENISNYMIKMIKNFNSANRLAQMIVLNSICLLGQNKIPSKTNFFAGFFVGGKLNKKNIITIIRNLPEDGICELMCHPGFNVPNNPYLHWGYHSQEEVDTLVDEEVKNLIAERGILLTSFNKLI